MASSGTLRRVALVRTDVSEERSASFISVTRIGELGTTLKNCVFWDLTPCGSCKNRRFGGLSDSLGISSQLASVVSYS
jgi:hypothetical protein